MAKPITTNGKEILVFDVPKDTEARIIDHGLKGLPQLIQFNSIWPKVAPIHVKLPEGNCKGKLFSEMSEEECSALVQIYAIERGCSGKKVYCSYDTTEVYD